MFDDEREAKKKEASASVAEEEEERLGLIDFEKHVDLLQKTLVSITRDENGNWVQGAQQISREHAKAVAKSLRKK